MTTYASAELADLAEQIPSQSDDKGMQFIEEADCNKEADVTLSAATVELDTALAIASSSQAPFVSLDILRFDSELIGMLVKDKDGDDLPKEVEQVISAARSHDSEVQELTLWWPAQGLIFKWVAQADWHDEFYEKLTAARTGATLEAHEEFEEKWALQKAQMKELREALSASREFRFASPKKRRPLAETIGLSIAGDLISSGEFSRTLREANALVERNVFEYECALQPQMPALAVELRNRPEWRSAMTQIRMRETTLNFLAEKADGYRLSTAFVEQTLQTALGPN